MADLNKIVVHARDGKLFKGTTQDFFPNRPLFHIQPAEGGEPVEVRCKSLKAVFFVRDFQGDAQRQNAVGFLAAPAVTKQGMKIAVREGFFMFPADAKSNNTRIYVIVASTAEVKAGTEAEALVKRSLEQRKNRDEAA